MSTTSGFTSQILKTENIEWRKMQFIQADDFKEWVPGAHVKLLNSLKKYQFVDPFKVWQSGNIIYCLDGRHRYLDLLHAEEKGFKMPDLLPANFINCKTKRKAAELVLVYSSIYAKITQKGLFDFLESYDIGLKNLQDIIEIPDFDIKKFLGDIDKDFAGQNEELDMNEFTNEVTMKLIFIKDDYILVKNKIGEMMKRRKIDSPEELFKKLLGIDK